MNGKWKMENGKFLWLFLLPILLFANVEVFVNKKVLIKGEPLIISIKASGKDIEFPKLDSIAGYQIISRGTSTSMQIINGEISKSETKQFVIYPSKNLTIPSFFVKVDGKVYKTKPIEVRVVKPKPTKGKFELDINISKNELYLGESAILTLKFKKALSANLQSIEIEAPRIDGFLLKKISQKSYSNTEFEITEYKFLLIPQKVGTFEIGPLLARVGYLVRNSLFNDPFFNVADVRYKNIYSNTIKLKVKPIPVNSIYGDFNISLNVENKRVKANTPNKAVLKISGCGDFSSLNEFNLNTDATVYKNKPIKKVSIQNNKMCGEFKQTFTLLSDKNYTIAPITLNTFDGKLKTISTKPVKVEVYGAPQKTKVIEKVVYKEKKSYVRFYKGLVLGLILGIGIGLLISYLLKFRCNLNLNDKDLYAKLLPYANKDEVKEVLKLLEENIYKNANNKIDRKKLKKYIC